MNSTDSVHLTRHVNWDCRSARISSIDRIGRADTLPMIGIFGCAIGAVVTAWLKLSWACRMSGEWAAMLTAKGTARFAPASLAAFIA